MLPNHLWPILFFVCLLISIAILACLTFTVFSIILDRRNSTREDSPAERYYTFEGSVNGAFEDDETSVEAFEDASAKSYVQYAAWWYFARRGHSRTWEFYPENAFGSGEPRRRLWR
ncbi:hypothetical protein TrVFT333_011712 [Trichoderma virens FT-333]|nr:hypothetical protein TrVFT333_011712 [Trichoderma virens FT-333]